MKSLLKILTHCIIAAVLMSAVDWLYDDWRELAWGTAIIAGFVFNELHQHDWKYSRMDLQSWSEWIYPAAVVLIIYAL